ncbi:uncharacterized protein LOC112098966 [Citrus clementina]|uniref:uncharacterized protein LOC112098966 n=1 Tax=Citrus clementina TaxID=85681 RepID=UPI000CED07A8|nr:uncharacterized protein LOC112098966 [Citrus x clementina]
MSEKPQEKILQKDEEIVENPELISWESNDGLLMSWLLGLMTEEVLSSNIGMETAFHLWTSLEDQLLPVTKEKEVYLRDRMLTLKKNNLTLAEYTWEFKNLCDSLAAINKPVDDLNKVFNLARGLGLKYQDFRYDRDEEDIPEALAAMKIEGQMDNNLYADSGATAHMTNDPGIIKRLKPYHGNSSIYVGNGNSLNISHVGQTKLNTANGKLLLKDVLVVPKLTKNLISVSQLTSDNKCTVEFSSNDFLIKDRQGRMLAKGHKKASLYALEDIQHEALSAIKIAKAPFTGNLELASFPESDAWLKTSFANTNNKMATNSSAHYCNKNLFFDLDLPSDTPPTTVTHPIQEEVHTNTDIDDATSNNEISVTVLETTNSNDSNPAAVPITSDDIPLVVSDAIEPTRSDNSKESTQDVTVNSSETSLEGINIYVDLRIPHESGHSSQSSSSNQNLTAPHHMITRRRLKNNPKLADQMALNVQVEPKSWKFAIKQPHWKSAMEEEIRALEHNETWVLVPRPKDLNVVGSKWVFKNKFKKNGIFNRHKARLVAQGYT